MANDTVSRWTVHLRLLSAELGYLPLLATAILALATAGYVGALPLQQDILAKNRRALATLLAAPAAEGSSRQIQARHDEFRARLSPLSERGNLLKALFKEAAEAGLTLSQGDYLMQFDADCNCRQLQVTLPVRGTYPQIRAFVDATLETMPALSLDEISFRRDSVKTTVVESRLRLSLFLKDAE